MKKIKAHFVEVRSPTGDLWNFCHMEPHRINFLIIAGYEIFDYTVSLGMDPEFVSQEVCFDPYRETVANVQHSES